MKLYKVIAKCGHVGKKQYVLKTFAVKAEDGRDAAKIVRDFPRVKHHHKDAIKDVSEITEKQYDEIIEINRNDPYFTCSCVQDQRCYDEPDIYLEEKYLDEEISYEPVNKKRVYAGKILIRKPKRFIHNFFLEEGWAY